MNMDDIGAANCIVAHDLETASPGIVVERSVIVGEGQRDIDGSVAQAFGEIEQMAGDAAGLAPGAI